MSKARSGSGSGRRGLARALAARVHAWLPGGEAGPHRPALGEADLVATLSVAAGDPALAGACAAWQRGVPDAARAEIARYFRRRKQPAFFTDAATLAALATSGEVQHRDWQGSALARVARDRDEGLSVYASAGPALRRGFPWGAAVAGPGDDPLYPVRPHRFAFAPRMAMAVLYGELPAAAFAEILEDWMAFAARGESALPYLSTLVVIQRLLALSWAHAFLAAAPESPGGLRAELDVLRILHADLAFLLPRLGASYPNNHLLADRFAAWYIHLLFPELTPGDGGVEGCEAAWLAELERQTYADGTGFEHSLHYHELACEMAASYVLLCRRNGRAVPGEMLGHIERMLDCQVGLAGPACVTLPFGDATEDPMFPLDGGAGWATAALRELHRALFRPELRPAPLTAPSVERAFWLLGGALAPAPPRPAPETQARAWPDGGFCVFPDAERGGRLVFRTGPAAGRALVAGHMHADLLSVCLDLGVEPLVVDPGTWSYRRRAGWARDHLRGPAAHNGLALRGADPLGVVERDFRAGEVTARVTVTRSLLGGQVSWVEAGIAGASPYAGYRRGVVHVGGEYWVVYDRLPPAAADGGATLGLQLSPAARIRGGEDGVGVLVESEENELSIAADTGLEGPEIRCGQTEPAGGWVSPSYGELVAAPQLVYRAGAAARLTALVLEPGRAPGQDVRAELLDSGLALHVGGARWSDVILLAAEDARPVESAGLVSRAGLLWLRCEDGQPRRLRGLGLQRLDAPGLGIRVEAREPVREVGLHLAGRELEVRGCDPDRLSITFPAGARE